MSFSDFILVIIVLLGVACGLWVYDINPYSTKLHVYSQTCTNMILGNTYCKGDWVDNPVSSYYVDKEKNMVTQALQYQSDTKIYLQCSVTDRKNWNCTDDTTGETTIVKKGKIQYKENSDVRQITRLEWLQNKLLKKVN